MNQRDTIATIAVGIVLMLATTLIVIYKYQTILEHFAPAPEESEEYRDPDLDPVVVVEESEESEESEL